MGHLRYRRGYGHDNPKLDPMRFTFRATPDPNTWAKPHRVTYQIIPPESKSVPLEKPGSEEMRWLRTFFVCMLLGLAVFAFLSLGHSTNGTIPIFK